MVVCSPADGRIVTVDHTGARAPDGVEVLDFGPAATVMPGLVDAHVHLCWDPHDDPVEQFLSQPDEVLAARAQAALEASLRAGITTVRDLGDRRYLTLDVRTRSAATPWLAPEIVVAGPPITPPKGHCWFLGGEALGIDAVVAAVDERAGHGVDVIKVMATGGMLTPGWGLHESQYDTATLAAAVTAARRHGLPVTTHAHGRSRHPRRRRCGRPRHRALHVPDRRRRPLRLGARRPDRRGRHPRQRNRGVGTVVRAVPTSGCGTHRASLGEPPTDAPCSASD